MTTTTQRGLGAEHQALRSYKLAVLVPGSPCRRCGHPRYHPGRCPHGPCWLCTLDLGHFTDRVNGGQGPRELEHSFLQPLGWRDARQQAPTTTTATPTPAAPAVAEPAVVATTHSVRPAARLVRSVGQLPFGPTLD